MVRVKSLLISDIFKVNELNSPKDRYWQNALKNVESTKESVEFKDKIRLKMTGWKKIFQANSS